MFFQKASNSAGRHNSSSGSRSAHGASPHSTHSASYAVGSSHRSGLRSKEVVITDPYLDALTKDTKARTRKRFSVSTSWTKISKSFALIFWGGSFCSLKPDNDQIMAQLRGLQSAFFGKIPRSVNGLRLCSFPSRLDYLNAVWENDPVLPGRIKDLTAWSLTAEIEPTCLFLRVSICQ